MTVKLPAAGKAILQLPVPPESVMVQVAGGTVFAEMPTVPVGAMTPGATGATVTDTVRDAKGAEWRANDNTVVVGPLFTTWLALPVLPT